MYPWLVFVHLLGLIVFVAMHGVAMFVAFRIGRSATRPSSSCCSRCPHVPIRRCISDCCCSASVGSARRDTAGLLVAPWIVASYIVLIVVFIAMYALGAGFYYPLREELDGKEGAPPLEGDALVARLQNRRPEALAVFGFGGLALLTWLMVFKPG